MSLVSEALVIEEEALPQNAGASDISHLKIPAAPHRSCLHKDAALLAEE